MTKIVDWNESLPSAFLKHDINNESSAESYKEFFIDILRYQGFKILDNERLWNELFDNLSDDLLLDGINQLWCVFLIKNLYSSENVEKIVNEKDVLPVSKGIKKKSYSDVFYPDGTAEVNIPRQYVFDGNIKIAFQKLVEEVIKREIEPDFAKYFKAKTFENMVTFCLFTTNLHTSNQTLKNVNMVAIATSIQQGYPINTFEKNHYIARNLMEIFNSNMLMNVRLKNSDLVGDNLDFANRVTKIFCTAYQQTMNVLYLKEVESISKTILACIKDKKDQDSVIFPSWGIKKPLSILLETSKTDIEVEKDIESYANQLPQIFKDFQSLYERGKVNELITESESYSISIDIKTFTEEQEKKGIKNLTSVYNLKLLSNVISNLGLEYLDTYVNTKKQSVNFVVSNFEKLEVKKEDYQDFSKKLVNCILENMQFDKMASPEKKDKEILGRELESHLEEFIMKYSVKNTQVVKTRVLKH